MPRYHGRGNPLIVLVSIIFYCSVSMFVFANEVKLNTYPIRLRCGLLRVARKDGYLHGRLLRYFIGIYFINMYYNYLAVDSNHCFRTQYIGVFTRRFYE